MSPPWSKLPDRVTAVEHVSNVAEVYGIGELLLTRCRCLVVLILYLSVLPCCFDSARLSAQDKDLRQKRELEQWQGTWRAVAGERDGQPRPKGFLEAMRVTVQNDVMTIQVGKRSQNLRLVLDSTARPKAVDLIHLDGKEQGEVWLGIYQLQSHRLKLCVSPPGVPRPDDFLTRPGSGRELLTLERQDSRNKPLPDRVPGK